MKIRCPFYFRRNCTDETVRADLGNHRKNAFPQTLVTGNFALPRRTIIHDCCRAVMWGHKQTYGVGKA